ncbi:MULTISPECIES: malonic semialdehyde reductase [Nocardiopsidaceae]|jgi:3-hydroxypropanoate dehydrogenase|uniref:Malonic semialdehyde reductase n=2 Tax=Nocardiopsidaceae TaxID=83676 RepID=A0ABY6YQ67_9ACTN|nr:MULTISPECIES: malonic semialdehyde reductase [Nocardiopsaceae]MEE2052585.1 malonic semialdehyde reductase [Nocardiopsis umidischolae]WAE74440.1 malonic semialdehyde reductase [Streptomonospora nanhaiensis]
MSETLVLDKAAQDLLFRDARTANSFTDEPVTDEQVRAIHDLVKYGPTAMNNQPLRVTVVRSPEARERLVPHMAGNNAPKTSTAPLTLILSADSDFHEHFPKTFPVAPDARDNFAGMPVEARETMAAQNTLLQIAYLIVGVRAAGLAAGPMTGFDAEGVRREFFGEDSPLRPLVVMNIGNPGPDAWFDRLPRLDFEEAFTEV